ncbi:MAG: CaiB/BaiF CoA transferase family protein [Alphaproteobacteria bacterium]|jgi:crotonobetainyl-CoA:carnitine CoA-transferase CaiB-like acyl-CoA transferase
MANSALPPLAGKLVLDFTRVLAGPWSTLNLADLGAEVVKVEHPKTGDDTRHYAPSADHGGETAYFLFVNRNKRSLALDIAKPEGQAVIKRLIAKADVLIENFRPDVMQRKGLDYDSVKAINPGLVYCSISGYGHASPLKLVAGYDPVAQAESGMMWMSGEGDGDPLRTGISYADIFTGMFATQAILGALIAKERDDVGQFIDLALLDSALAVTANYGQVALMTGESPKRYGNGHPFLEPFGLAETADGQISVVIGNVRQWERFCTDVIGKPEWITDEKFGTNDGRMANAKEFRPLLNEILRQDTRENWIEKFRRAGVPAGSIRDLTEAMGASEVRARGMIAEVDHPRAGKVEMVTSPIRYSGTPVAQPVAAPTLGQDSAAVLADCGFSADEIAALAASGVVVGVAE